MFSKTHLFDGRYENIYLDEKHIPQLKELMDEATVSCRTDTDRKACALATGLTTCHPVQARHYIHMMTMTNCYLQSIMFMCLKTLETSSSTMFVQR